MTDIDDLLRKVDELPSGELDKLPYGMIQLDPNGRILRFNKTEAELARIRQESQLGRNFFDDVAPCTKVKTFYGRFTEGVRQKKLHETFGFDFAFPHGKRRVAITLFYAEKTDTMWVLVSQLALEQR